MTPAQVRNEIERLINTLYAEKLAIDNNKPVLLSVTGSSMVSWSNDVDLSSQFSMDSAYDIYLETLRKRWFSVVLFDGSLIQFSYTFAGNQLKKHRLCYMPCPIRIKEYELGHFTLEELLEIIEGHEFKDRVRLEGPLRFDFDVDAGAVDHPPSHLTISRISCRIPVSFPVSVGHFVKFLFMHFYSDHWSKSPDIRNWACTSLDNCLPDIDENHIFVSWNRKH